MAIDTMMSTTKEQLEATLRCHQQKSQAALDRFLREEREEAPGLRQVFKQEVGSELAAPLRDIERQIRGDRRSGSLEAAVVTELLSWAPPHLPYPDDEELAEGRHRVVVVIPQVLRLGTAGTDRHGIVRCHRCGLRTEALGTHIMPRTCTVCIHPKRPEIDGALLAHSASLRDIARQHNVSKDALQRHKADHLPERMAKVARRREEADVRTAIDVVGQLRAINEVSLTILNEARERQNEGLALQAIDRIQKQIELQAKLIDLIRDGDTFNIVISPQWAEIRTVILAALQPYPEAAQAVAGSLQLIEGGTGHAAD